MNLRARLPLTLLLFVATLAAADDGFPRVPPTEPDQAAATFEVLHGFRMELIAAEPLVASPVDLAYDEDGRAYAVEMRDYPYPEEKNAEPKEFPGTVRLLEDTDGDGRFDKSTIFADQLAWPTSACCWKGGVFVAAAPDIWYFKDTGGDGRADIRRKVFTGFGRYNVQAIMNNLRWGLDNKIYGAAAGNGGAIRHAERPDEPSVSLARRDFRFDPVTEKLEAISGGERFGNAFDDWGNRFVCNIRNPVQHVVLEQRYLARNPHLVVPSVIHDCAESGDQLRVFRLSPPEPWRVFRAQRWALEGQAMPRSELIGAGYWTSSSGVTIYRGGAYPPEFRGNVFIGEVAGNLVHRQLLTRDGVTFKSRRADESTEFIRSRDNWFRPVNFVNAPDGTLHVVDMYRETIEHPWSIPDDIKAQLDLTSGKDRGRIYRLSPPNRIAPKPPQLTGTPTATLVAYLRSPDSWWRETAQRLIVERQDRDAVAPLQQIIADRNSSPTARLHALCALDGLGKLDDPDVLRATRDNPPEVARHIVKLLEQRHERSKSLSNGVSSRALNPDISVRFQAALSLGELKPDDAYAGLSTLIKSDAGDPWMRTAILSSASQVADRLALDLIGADSKEIDRRGRLELVRRLTALAAAAQDERALARLLHVAAWNDARQPLELRLAIMTGAHEGLATRKLRLVDILPKLGDETVMQVNELQKIVAKTAAASDLPVLERLPALELLAFSPWPDARVALLASLQPREPQEVQQTALRVLGRFANATVATELISRWKQLTPPLREETANVLLSRPLWYEPLISALETGDIPLAQLSMPQRQRLAAVKDASLAERAKKVLGSIVIGPRKEVVEKYQAALTLKTDPSRGAVVYRRECANCHRFANEGHDVGPNLATIVHRSPQEILIHVLDPNREVSPNFLDYSVRLTDGRVLTGLIATETDAGLTLRRAENREDTVLRSEIDEISSSGKSLMPEGLEQKISLDEMADLTAFLRNPTTHLPSP